MVVQSMGSKLESSHPGDQRLDKCFCLEAAGFAENATDTTLICRSRYTNLNTAILCILKFSSIFNALYAVACTRSAKLKSAMYNAKGAP